MISRPNRKSIGALIVSASLLVGVAVHEGYTGKAVQPLPGDKWTFGFGDTVGVHRGDTTNPVRSLIALESDLDERKATLGRYIHVPLTQYELDAYMDLAYNIGLHNFTSSTLLTELNKGHYQDACVQILRWGNYHGRFSEGLYRRRVEEFNTC